MNSEERKTASWYDRFEEKRILPIFGMLEKVVVPPYQKIAGLIAPTYRKLESNQKWLNLMEGFDVGMFNSTHLPIMYSV